MNSFCMSSFLTLSITKFHTLFIHFCQPTAPPTQLPSASPNKQPTPSPSVSPSKGPSSYPSNQPTAPPTANPSKAPTLGPSMPPTNPPTTPPTLSVSCLLPYLFHLMPYQAQFANLHHIAFRIVTSAFIFSDCQSFQSTISKSHQSDK